MNDKVLKILSITATVIGIAASAVSGWVSEKQLDSKIAEEVSKAMQTINNEVKES